MKTILAIIFVSTALVSGAQAPAKWFRNGSIKLEYSPSPLFYVFNKSTTNKAGSPGWLLVNVKYTAASRKERNRMLWLNDITMETELIVPSTYKGRRVIVLMRGRTTFWSIPMDGKTHRALGCVPPQVVTRFAQSGSKIELSKIMARVTFYTSGRKIIARMYNSSSRRVREYFNKIGGAVSSGVLIVDDIVMPRSKTPWAVINYELFDVIKPDSQR